MRPKIIGIGKCGSRVTFDFFAYISDMSSAYNIRTRQLSNFDKILAKLPGISHARELAQKTGYEFRTWWHDFFGVSKLYVGPELITIDSDRENNEIINFIADQLRTEDEIISDSAGVRNVNGQSKKIIFPGRSVSFSDHVGGCDFHIVSENIATYWNIPATVSSSGDFDIVVVAFSAGGGTGGGAAPVVLSRCKAESQRNKRTEKRLPHFMGLAVLPESDEQYTEEPHLEAVSSGEKYNTGRFFAGIYGGREYGNQRTADSIWLVSNDCLQTLTTENIQSSNTLDKNGRNLSKLNFYMAACLATICNASSKLTKSQPNFDAFEMSNRLSGSPFISAFASMIPDAAMGQENYLIALQRIFLMAVSNMDVYDTDNSLFGLSVPVREKEYQQVLNFLGGSQIKSLEELQKRAALYEIKEAPLEFRTASRIVMIYGQSEKTYSIDKDSYAKKICHVLFPNSDFHPYHYTHSGAGDRLLILLINPFVRFIQKSIYYYSAQTWVKEAHQSRCDEIFDNAILAAEYSSDQILPILKDNEIVELDVHGQGTIEFFEQRTFISAAAASSSPTIALNKTNLIRTFNTLHSIYHHKKIPTSRPSKI